MRGAGPKGLAAMPILKPFAQGFQARPLLSFPRSDLQQYAEEYRLTWVEDESNSNLSFSRNFIRHDIMPRLKSRWPAVASSVARSAAHCAENQMLLELFSAEQTVQVKGSRENTLSVAKLLQCSAEKQRLILRTWIHELKHTLPNTKIMDTIQRDVLCAAWDSSPIVQWGNVMLRRHRDDIHLVQALEHNKQSVMWELELPIVLPNVGVLKTVSGMGCGLRADIANVLIGFRQGGEVVELRGRGRQTLKNLFQEWNVLPWERDSIPLVFIADKLIAIAGYFLHEDFAVKENEMGREIVFERFY
jgi:tRNA(Ile)-lysidine synthase